MLFTLYPQLFKNIFTKMIVFSNLPEINGFEEGFLSSGLYLFSCMVNFTFSSFDCFSFFDRSNQIF